MKVRCEDVTFKQSMKTHTFKPKQRTTPLLAWSPTAVGSALQVAAKCIFEGISRGVRISCVKSL